MPAQGLRRSGTHGGPQGHGPGKRTRGDQVCGAVRRSAKVRCRYGEETSDADQVSGRPATRTKLERRKQKGRAHQRAGRAARRRAGRRAEPEPDSQARLAPRAGSAEGVCRAALPDRAAAPWQSRPGYAVVTPARMTRQSARLRTELILRARPPVTVARRHSVARLPACRRTATVPGPRAAPVAKLGHLPLVSAPSQPSAAAAADHVGAVSASEPEVAELES